METACLANVQPPAPTYRHHVRSCVEKSQLSSAQIETIIYANQRFELPPLPDGALYTSASVIVPERHSITTALHCSLQ